MAHRKILVPFLALASLGLAACANQSNDQPPQTPADETRTTGAATYPAQPASTMAAPPDQPAMVQPNTPSAASGSTTGSTWGVAAGSPMDTTAGTSTAQSSAGSSAGSMGAAGSTGSAEKPLDEGQIAGVIHTADEGEIAQARQAVRNAKSDRVKQFAQHMVTDHSAAEAKLTALHIPSTSSPESAISDGLRSKSREIMEHLKSATGSDFDREYIGAQVMEHTKVLDLLDNKLIPNAQNAELRKTLQEIRAKVESHLTMAEKIQSEIGQAAQ
jgi:putative membrane protein